MITYNGSLQNNMKNLIYSKLKRLLQRNQIDKLDFHKTYPKLVKDLKETNSYSRAMELAVGGEFEAVGKMECEILQYFGLKNDGYLIDVGCGSGRLAKPLSQYLNGKYLGIDIVPELIEYARELVPKPNWKFEVAKGLSISESDNKADMVCFFSVFTHLLHEQSYIYLQEAKRVLKPSGKIVFSFLDFTVAAHWEVFENNVKGVGISNHPLNIFIGRDAIQAWASHLDLEVEKIQGGDEHIIPLSQPITFENGTVMKEFGTVGQSVCVLSIK